jgi:prevent-host-death family protein
MMQCFRTTGIPVDNAYDNAYVNHGGNMPVLTASDARARLYRLIDQTNDSHEPVIISGKRNNAVLISEEDWKAIQETLFLVSIPGMKESIVDGMKEPLDKSIKNIEW